MDCNNICAGFLSSLTHTDSSSLHTWLCVVWLSSSSSQDGHWLPHSCFDSVLPLSDMVLHNCTSRGRGQQCPDNPARKRYVLLRLLDCLLSRGACVSILDVYKGGMPWKSLSTVSPHPTWSVISGHRSCLWWFHCWKFIPLLRYFFIFNCVCVCGSVHMSAVPAKAREAVLYPGAGVKQQSWATQMDA